MPFQTPITLVKQLQKVKKKKNYFVDIMNRHKILNRIAKTIKKTTCLQRKLCDLLIQPLILPACVFLDQ